MTEINQKPALSRSKWSWLESQSAEWVAGGLIAPEARATILESYEVQSMERRSLMALMLLGALMFGIGVLLLIGYNWSALSANVKIGMILASVALAFAGSAATYARRHPAIGETLAVIGVLLYGNGIWLIAQVLHIRGDFADAFMWWAAGALVCAWLVRSSALAIGGAALVLVWTIAAGAAFDRPQLSFLIMFTLAVGVAYARQSPLTLAAAALSMVAWMCWAQERAQPAMVSVGAAALSACACYAVGAWHRPENRLGRAWQLTGLLVLAGAFVPLLIRQFHDATYHRPVTWASLLLLMRPFLVTCSLSLRRLGDKRGLHCSSWRQAADIAVIAVAVAIITWLALLAGGATRDRAWAYGATLTFSLIALSLSVSLIRKALRQDSIRDLSCGVLFALVFLLMRWASLIDSMLWSGVMLLTASATFFAIARLWSRRNHRRPALLPTTLTGVAR